MPMGIVVFLVLLFLFVVLFVRAKNESTDKKAAIQPESQDDYKSPFDAGPLTLQQKNQDDWDGPGKVLKSDRFWGERQKVLVPVLLDYVSAKGERSEREVDIHAFQLYASDEGKQTMFLHAFCHLRNARRYFVSSRAKSITVIETGEVFTNDQQFCEFLSDHYAQSTEGKLDSFFGEIGADIAEVALYLGRMEGKLKARAKKVLIPVLAGLAGVEAVEMKDSTVCKEVLKSVGFEAKDYRKATTKLIGNESPDVRAALKSLLEELSVDNKGKPDEVIAAMAAKTLKKIV